MRTDAGGQGTTCTTYGPPTVLHEERTERAAGNAHPPHAATAEERLHPGAATSLARVGMRERPAPRAPQTEDIVASMFNEVAPTADQGLQTDEHLQDDELFAAFMAFCQDGAATTGPAITSALQHTAQNRELTSPTPDPISASHQAHLRRNYASLGPVSAANTTIAGAGHARGQSVEMTSQRPHTHRVVRSEHQQLPAASVGPWSRCSPDWPNLGDRRAWTMPDPKGTASATLRRRTVQLPLTWTCPGTSDAEQLTIQVRTLSVLMNVHHIRNNTHTMADIIINHREGRQSPPPTMEHPSKWPYAATRLMAHIRVYTQDDTNKMHWRWHHREALRIREVLI